MSDEQSIPPGWRRVRPGLYERIDTPRVVALSDRFLAAIRAESPYLADLLEQMDRRRDQGAMSGEER